MTCQSKFYPLNANLKVWDEDVSLYAVHDDSADGGILGYFFLDLFPRPGRTVGLTLMAYKVPLLQNREVRTPVCASNSTMLFTPRIRKAAGTSCCASGTVLFYLLVLEL